MAKDPQFDPQAELAGAPHATPEQLQQLAYERPDLWETISQHPNAYAELLQWIATRQPQDSPAEEATAQEDAAPVESSTPEAATGATSPAAQAEPSPQQQPDAAPRDPEFDPQAELAGAPHATPEQLQQLAHERPDLWETISQHPNAYAELLQWIATRQPQDSPVEEAPTPEAPTAPDPAETNAAVPTEPEQWDLDSTDETLLAAPVPLEALQAEVAAPGQVPPQKKGRKLAVIVAVVALAGLLGAGVGYWLFGKGGQGSLAATAVSNAPTTVSVVNLGDLDPAAQFAPIGPARSPYLAWQDQYIVAFNSERGGDATIVAVDWRGEADYAEWSVSVPAEAVQQGCGVEGGTLVCGAGPDAAAVDLATGKPAQANPAGSAVKPNASGSTAETPGARSEEVPPAETEDEAGGGDEPATGGPLAQSGAQSEGTERNEEPRGTLSHKLGNEPSEEVPYYVSGGELLDRDGKVVATDLPDGPLWAAQVGDSDWWLISNGKTLLGVHGQKEAWRIDLPAGTAELNGFTGEDEPGWYISGDAVLLANDQGVQAVNATDGELIWQVEIPVSTWVSSDETLLVETDGTLAVLPYPDEPSPEKHITLEVPEPAASMPTEEEIANATLAVSENCAEWANIPDYRAAQFTNGTATGEGYSAIHQAGLGYTTLNGAPVVVLALTCDGGGTGGFSDLNVYGPNLELLHHQQNYSEGISWTHRSSSPIISDLKVDGPNVTYQTQTMPVYAPNKGTEYVDATVELTWDGSEYVTERIVYNTPFGPAAAPNPALMREIFAAAQAGDDQAISAYVAGELLRSVASQEEALANREADIAAGGDPFAYEFVRGRNGFAPAKAEFGECVLVPEENAGAFFPQSRITLEVPFSVQDAVSEYQVQAGDFVCGMGWEEETGTGPMYDYWLWWLVRTDENGTPFVYRSGGKIG